jgi:hypothetical protein
MKLCVISCALTSILGSGPALAQKADCEIELFKAFTLQESI